MPTETGRMTGEEFRDALSILDMSLGAFADLLVALGDRSNDKLRTVQRWASGQQDVPGAVNALLQLMVLMQDNGAGTPETVRAWLADAAEEDAEEVATSS